MLKRILSLTLAAVLALAVFATAAFAEAIDEGITYFVYTENGKDLNVRNAPNGDIIGALHYGEEVKVTAIINDYWALIEFQDNVPGYVNTRFLVPVHPDEIKKARHYYFVIGSFVAGAFIGAFIFRNASPYEVLGIPAVLFVVFLLVSVEARKRSSC